MVKELQAVLKEFLPQDGRPVVVYSGLFAIARALPVSPKALPGILLEMLRTTVGPQRTLLMPTYTNGYQNGFLNLDTEPCNTGMVNEQLRQKGESVRTAAAFWSFATLGPDAAMLGNLRPHDAWGDGSLFDWIHRMNAHILMLGVPWYMCSFLHRVEWDAQVPYRYLKEFSGQIILRGQTETLRERLFVRSLQPKAENIWPHIDVVLAAHGMKRFPLGRGQVAEMGSQKLVECLLEVVRKNPFAFVKNPEMLRKHYHSNSTEMSHGN